MTSQAAEAARARSLSIAAERLLGLMGRIREFVEIEHDSRTTAGGRMTDYEGESQEALNDVDMVIDLVAERFAGNELTTDAPSAWVHTPAQLVADLRHACQAYRVDRFEALTEVARLTALIVGLQEGIAAAMVVLSEDLEAGEPVMFARGVTMWEHLALLRDPTGELPPPKGMFPATASMGQAYAALPRDPASGRPVIA